MIYNPNPSYKDNPISTIEILNDATVLVWETMEDYADTVMAQGGRWTQQPAIPGTYWVNSILDIPNVGIHAVCLHEHPQIRYATNTMDSQEYIAWGVPSGQYLIVQP